MRHRGLHLKYKQNFNEFSNLVLLHRLLGVSNLSIDHLIRGFCGYAMNNLSHINNLRIKYTPGALGDISECAIVLFVVVTTGGVVIFE